MDSAERDLLVQTATRLGVRLDDSHLAGLFTYLNELCIWNRRTNLTGLRSRTRMVVELLADSLVPVPFLPPSGRLLDVGSGAGLPGIPLKIVHPDLRVDLLEPASKRYHFLRQVIRLLGMEGLRALRGRAEDPTGPSETGGYDVVTSRAVAGLGRAVEMCAPHLAGGGLLVGFSGSRSAADLARAADAIAGAGLHLENTVTYRLPGAAGERRALLFRREAIS